MRLYAFLAQEKLLRDPAQIIAVVAEPIPRVGAKGDSYPDYFTPNSLWKWKQFWEFMGLPYEVVPLGIRDAVSRIRNQFANAMSGALSEEIDQAPG